MFPNHRINIDSLVRWVFFHVTFIHMRWVWVGILECPTRRNNKQEEPKAKTSFNYVYVKRIKTQETRWDIGQPLVVFYLVLKKCFVFCVTFCVHKEHINCLALRSRSHVVGKSRRDFPQAK
jgi:hypothetical protein